MIETFPRLRGEIVHSEIISGIFQSGRAKDHIFHQLKLLELVFELLRLWATSSPGIKDQSPTANFALPEEQQSDLGGSRTIRAKKKRYNKQEIK